MNQLIEYMKLHIISLEQDLERLNEEMESLDPSSKDYTELDIEYNWISGQVYGIRYILSVADDIVSGKWEEGQYV